MFAGDRVALASEQWSWTCDGSGRLWRLRLKEWSHGLLDALGKQLLTGSGWVDVVLKHPLSPSQGRGESIASQDVWHTAGVDRVSHFPTSTIEGKVA